jgi:maltooligosyltrehalose trehalohydrolase
MNRGTSGDIVRRLSQGAEIIDGGVHFRTWAPGLKKISVVIQESAGEVHPLLPEPHGYWSVMVPGIGSGTRYQYRLNEDTQGLPDPVSRSLPDGPHGPSQVVDPSKFTWSDQAWTGLSLKNEVIYEMHVGTFTAEGTWAAAQDKLQTLKELGITVIEMMPVNEFPGRFGWGYDGVAWFAPTHLYGTPDDLRRFIDRAHALGLGVILDVVYNHLGPDGNYLHRFSPHYFSQRSNDWGRSLNYDGKHSAAVRQLVVDNAVHWIDEYHFDGLRLDATQDILDDSPEHIIATLGREARIAARGRHLLLVAENEPQDSRLLRTTNLGGMGMDKLWNDDFHHSAGVALTGRRQAYYSDYQGTANEWIATVRHGFLFQGQRSAWQNQPRGHAARNLPAAAFVAFLENHDQIANSIWSERLWQQSSAGCQRAMTALLLLGPWTPLLFQGQEWNATTPFFYFADHHPELAKLVWEGRLDFMSQFPGCTVEGARDLIPDPASIDTYLSSKLRWEERATRRHRRSLQLHQDLLTIRREDPTIRAQADAGIVLEVATLSSSCGLLRYFVDGTASKSDTQERLLIVNLGAGFDLPSPSEPLLSSPQGSGPASWRILWSSEDPRYGGYGCTEPESAETGWHIPGFAAVLLGPSTIVEHGCVRNG